MSESFIRKHFKPRSKEWLEFRKGGLGASDAGSAIGISPFKSPLSLWLEKTKKVEPDDLSGNEYVYWGLELETPVIKRYKKEHKDYKVTRPFDTLISSDYPWMYVDPDGEIVTKDGRKGGVECKTSAYITGWIDEDGNETIPDHYLAQGVHCLAVTGWDFIDYPVLIGGNKYIERHLDRDDEDIKTLIEKESVFWNYFVLKDIMPGLVGHNDESGAVFSLHKESNGTSIFLEDDSAAYKYVLASKSMKDAEKEKGAAGTALRLLLGDSKTAENDFYKVTWLRTNESRIDLERLSEKHPEAYKDCLVTKPKDMGIRVTEKGK